MDFVIHAGRTQYRDVCWMFYFVDVVRYWLFLYHDDLTLSSSFLLLLCYKTIASLVYLMIRTILDRMLEINFQCGQWRNIDRVKWEFVFDDVHGCSFSMVNDDITLGELISVVFEDYGVDDALNAVSLSYKFNRVAADYIPPCYIINDRQLRSFVIKSQKFGEGIQLCVTFTTKNDIPQIQLQEQLPEEPMANVLCLGNTAENGVPMAKVVGASNSDEDSMSGDVDANVHIDEGIYMGQYYPTKEELMRNIRLHTLKESYEF